MRVPSLGAQTAPSRPVIAHVHGSLADGQQKASHPGPSRTTASSEQQNESHAGASRATHRVSSTAAGIEGENSATRRDAHDETANARRADCFKGQLWAALTSDIEPEATGGVTRFSENARTAKAAGDSRSDSTDTIAFSDLNAQTAQVLPFALALAASPGVSEGNINACRSALTSARQSGAEDQHPLVPSAASLAFTTRFQSPRHDDGDLEKSAVGRPGEAITASSIHSLSLEALSSAGTPTGTPIQGVASESALTSPFSSKLEERTDATRIEPIAELQEPAALLAAKPLKEIAFSVPGSQGVQVRISEQLGEVRVDVRTGNASLTQDLRSNLHDLTTRLESHGIASQHSTAAEGLNARLVSGQSSSAGENASRDAGSSPDAEDRRRIRHNATQRKGRAGSGTSWDESLLAEQEKVNR